MPTVSLDFHFNRPIERVWLALTDPKKLAKWVMENDFKPIVGHKFQFRTEPNPVWDGIVHSEVLVVDQPNKLFYTWETAGESTTVTWTLKEMDGTTHLHLEQIGFENEGHAYHGAKQGWTLMAKKLDQVLAEL
ncbi:SRPBCC family protein [Seinonella peptonophila]|nr:SRPBCC domain-containing protein [Seinonella peptonophila]